MTLTRLIFIVLVLYGGIHWWHQRPVSHGPGITASDEPNQSRADSDSVINKNGYHIVPLEDFTIDARVLSATHYTFGREADLSPVDLALGWGRMSDESVLKNISISQSGRFYFWQVQEFPIPREEIETHSANMHMIPADAEVEKTLLSIKQGQVVHISGYLVEAKADDGWHWRSSLTRNDTGAGACEVVYVKTVYVTQG